jgi:hypothetical protein
MASEKTTTDFTDYTEKNSNAEGQRNREAEKEERKEERHSFDL